MVSFHSERSEKPEKVTKIVSGFTTWKRKIVRNSIQEMHGLGEVIVYDDIFVKSHLGAHWKFR